MDSAKGPEQGGSNYLQAGFSALEKVRGAETLNFELRILVILDSEKRLRYTELRKKLGNPPKSTLSKVLTDMKERDYVRREEKSHKKVIYELGPSSRGLRHLQQKTRMTEELLGSLSVVGKEGRVNAPVLSRMLNLIGFFMKSEVLVSDESERSLFFETLLPKYLYEVSTIAQKIRERSWEDKEESFRLSARTIRRMKKEIYALAREW